MGLNTFKKLGTWTKIIALFCLNVACIIVSKKSFYVEEHGHSTRNFLHLAASAAIPVFAILLLMRIAGKAASPPLEAACDVAWACYCILAVILVLLGHITSYHSYNDQWYGDAHYYNNNKYKYQSKENASAEWVLKIFTALCFGIAALALIFDALMMLRKKKSSSGGDGE